MGGLVSALRASDGLAQGAPAAQQGTVGPILRMSRSCAWMWQVSLTVAHTHMSTIIRACAFPSNPSGRILSFGNDCDSFRQLLSEVSSASFELWWRRACRPVPPSPAAGECGLGINLPLECARFLLLQGLPRVRRDLGQGAPSGARMR